MSVPKTVKSLLSAQPLLFDFLRQGLANITAVAGQLQEAVEKELGRDVEIAAIGMAIRRVLEEETKFELSDWQFPPDLEISSKSNIYEVAIKRSSKSTKAIELVRQAVDTSSGGFLSIVEGTYEIVFFTNQSNKSLVKKIISRNKITSELTSPLIGKS